jgi:uncharacterized protein YqeY
MTPRHRERDRRGVRIGIARRRRVGYSSTIMSKLVETIRARVKDAMKARRDVEKTVLRVALGEVQSEEVRRGSSLDDGEVAKILRKLVKSNRETIAVTEDAARKAELEEEVVVLESLLPKRLTEDEVVDALGPVADDIRGAKADGPAMGIAMKHLKSTGAAVDGKVVNAAVRKLRAG